MWPSLKLIRKVKQRLAAIKRSHRCAIFGSRRKLVFHHFPYRSSRPYLKVAEIHRANAMEADWLMRGLILLCKGCHIWIHQVRTLYEIRNKKIGRPLGLNWPNKRGGNFVGQRGPNGHFCSSHHSSKHRPLGRALTKPGSAAPEKEGAST
jgi:hypothetical protein